MAGVATLILLMFPLALLDSFHGPDAGDFHTLANSGSAQQIPSGQLRVVFKTDLSRSAMDLLLLEVGGARVDGPNRLGAYTVRLAGANDVDAALSWLRAQPGVMLAEPVVTQSRSVQP